MRWFFVGLFLSLWRVESPALSAELAYSFRTQNSGGLAVVFIDESKGKFANRKTLLASSKCQHANKVRRSGSFLMVSNSDDEDPCLFVLNRVNQNHERLALPASPVEMQASNRHLLITCEDDWIVSARLDDLSDVKKLNSASLTRPPANAPRDIAISNSGQYALIACRNDSKKGKKLGNRLLTLDLETLQLVSDYRLPRDLPQLHVRQNLRYQGPTPESVTLCEQTNTVLVTLSLYGGISIFDWNQILSGKTNLSSFTMSTALDNQWGTSFPERVCVFENNESSFALICNSGKSGGATLVNLGKKSIGWKADVPAGLERPVYHRKTKKAYSVCSGRIRFRTTKEIDEQIQPHTELFEFDLGTNIRQSANVRRFDIGHPTHRVALIGEHPWLLVAVGDGLQASKFVLIDPMTKQIVDRQNAFGRIIRLEH